MRFFFVSCFARWREHKKGGNDRARARESTWDSRLIADVNWRPFGLQNRVRSASKLEMIRELSPNWVQIVVA